MTTLAVHATHCCKAHGCKYRGECPVVKNEIKQVYPCEICSWEREALEDATVTPPPGVELLRKDNVCEVWTIGTALGAVDLFFYHTGQTVVNTAPYGPDLLAWIAAKAQLMEVKNR